MTIYEFEKQIKEKINSNLSVVPHPFNTDMAGVYWRNVFICGIPNENIFENRNPGYVSKFGVPHRTTGEAIAKINRFLARLSNEEGFLELMTEPI